MLEQLALGTNARLSLELVDVVAERSTGFAGSGFGNTVLVPGNNADCLLSASGGAGNSVDLVVRESRLTDCANNGITFGSAVANGEGPTARLSLEMSDTTVTGNRGANLRVGNETGLEELSVKVERSNLSDSQGTGSGVANVTFEELGTTTQSEIDLGGGPLGSAGQNCLEGGNLAAHIMGYDVSAVGNWWGAAGGPAPGRTVVAGGSLAHSPASGRGPAGRLLTQGPPISGAARICAASRTCRCGLQTRADAAKMAPWTIASSRVSRSSSLSATRTWSESARSRTK